MNLQSILRRALVIVFVGSVALAPLTGMGDTGSEQRLSFDVDEGKNLNSFLRDGPVAAHLLLRSGSDPRILVAFPAGNSGVGLWFSHSTAPVTWKLLGRAEPVTVTDERGRPLYGMTVEASVTGPSELSVHQAVLSSVRVLRNYQAQGTFPAEVATNPTIQNSTITWARDRLDGAAGYRLSVEITAGTLQADHFKASSEGTIRLKITAVSGETPLTPLSGTNLLNSSAAADAIARQTLTFLSYAC
jgi:hypothetical protein